MKTMMEARRTRTRVMLHQMRILAGLAASEYPLAYWNWAPFQHETKAPLSVIRSLEAHAKRLQAAGRNNVNLRFTKAEIEAELWRHYEGA
jgi:hypothetical protein